MFNPSVLIYCIGTTISDWRLIVKPDDTISSSEFKLKSAQFDGDVIIVELTTIFSTAKSLLPARQIANIWQLADRDN